VVHHGNNCGEARRALREVFCGIVEVLKGC
jgi:hypothetical protein